MHEGGSARESSAGSPKQEVLNVRAEAMRRRTPLQRAIGRVAAILAHPVFLLAELVLHAGWLLLNSEIIPGVTPWDPYPFSLLTGIASIQALIIGLLILMYAEFDAHIADVRGEVDLQVALHSERETSKVLRMLGDIHRALDVRGPEDDQELERMSQPLDPAQLTEVTDEHITEAEDEE